MSRVSQRALVIWSRENKTGIEAISSVPSNARFEGAVSPVLFSGDKRYYPAKVIMISDDMRALEARATEVEADLMNKQLQQQPQQPTQPVKKSSRKRKQASNAGAASEREVAVALGGKPPVPKNVEHTHKATQRAEKDAKETRTKAQRDVDKAILGTVRRELFMRNEAIGTNEKDDGDTENNDCSGNEGSDKADDDGGSAEGDGMENTECVKDDGEEKWCGCKTCAMMQKYDSPVYYNFLKDICDLFEGNVESGPVKYLELQPLCPDTKKVELTQGSGIYISASDKDQMKVDFRNRPTALAREALFSLYGREVFQVLDVTGKGKKRGSYTIPENVKQAICSFVNRNVDIEKKMKTCQLVTLINKRAPEWRKSASPKTSFKKSGTKKKVQAVSTSPFKVTPIQPSPRKPSPRKPSPHKPSPRQSSPLKATPEKDKTTVELSVIPDPPSFQSASAALRSHQSNPAWMTGQWGPASGSQMWNYGGEWGPNYNYHGPHNYQGMTHSAAESQPEYTYLR